MSLFFIDFVFSSSIRKHNRIIQTVTEKNQQCALHSRHDFLHSGVRKITIIRHIPSAFDNRAADKYPRKPNSFAFAWPRGYRLASQQNRRTTRRSRIRCHTRRPTISVCVCPCAQHNDCSVNLSGTLPRKRRTFITRVNVASGGDGGGRVGVNYTIVARSLENLIPYARTNDAEFTHANRTVITYDI